MHINKLESIHDQASIETSIAPWLPVTNSLKALDFYQKAFGAEVNYKMEITDGIIARLSVDGADFWITEADTADWASRDKSAGPVRMIITMSDPDALFLKATQAGATVIFPIGEAHGWRLGRLSDPFGYQWEIGTPLDQ